MGEAQNQPFQLSFNPTLKVEFQGSRVTSDGGLVLVRVCEKSAARAVIPGLGVRERRTDSSGGHDPKAGTFQWEVVRVYTSGNQEPKTEIQARIR